MKERILFVDDEPMVLRAMERLLHPMRNCWEMEFVDSGEKALARMEEAPFDVLVSDMRMPGMNGAQLLNEVLKRHPQVVRLILSGYADHELLFKCIGATHQYLSKPCDPETLKATIERATALKNSLESQTLRKVISGCERLPTVPVLYHQIVEAVNDPNIDLESVSDIISRDTAMTAHILKMVNSAFFGLSRPMANPRDAVAHLGVDTIKSLILVAGAFSQFDCAPLEGFSLEGLWKHSLKVGRLAMNISSHENMDRKSINESYTAGLLHDAGKLILALNLGPDYGEAIKMAQNQKIVMTEAEKKVFGTEHACVGGYLLGLWGLPVPIVEAIALHHRPESGRQNRLTPLTVVHAADALVSLDEPLIAGVPPSELKMSHLVALGLENHVADWRRLQRNTVAGL